MTAPQPVEIPEAVVNELKGRIRGPLLRPGQPGFDEARSVWNAMIDRHPALIVRCLGVTDVVACVNAARTHGLPLSIKGGGHNIAGLAVCEGGLMLDMSLMRGVWVDPAARLARAQAGCLLADVDAEAQLHGLAPVLGFVSNTGCAGLTLGGGFGYLSRRFGWTTDNLASVDLVTAAVGSSAPPSARTPSCSGGCAGAAATSGWSPASSTRSTPSGRRWSPARSPGGRKRPPASSRCIAPSPRRRRAS